MVVNSDDEYPLWPSKQTFPAITLDDRSWPTDASRFCQLSAHFNQLKQGQEFRNHCGYCQRAS